MLTKKAQKIRDAQALRGIFGNSDPYHDGDVREQRPWESNECIQADKEQRAHIGCSNEWECDCVCHEAI